MSKAQKPPTQVAGVVGIAATPVTLNPQIPARINWQKVFALPCYQMFAVERSARPAGTVTEWVEEWSVQHGDEAEVLAEYCDWHAAKGYWPNETPFGELIEDQEKASHG